MPLMLTKEKLYCLDKGLYPMPVLSDNLRAVFSAGIKGHTKGFYSHFMWLIGPNTLASMGPRGFRIEKLDDYTRFHRLKVFFFPNWSQEDKQLVQDAIQAELALPWYKRRYDFLAYLGHLTNWRWIQSPWSEVCSDMIKFAKLVEKDFGCRKFPNPQDVNEALENLAPRCRVYGRYIPD